MGKKTEFDWVRDAEEPTRERKDRVTRRQKREVADEADTVADAILNCLPAEFKRLQLPDQVRQAASDFHRIRRGNHGALRRQRLRLSALLRTQDLEPVKQSLGLGEDATRERDAVLEALVRWRSRIIEEGDPALQSFMEAYPTADRQQLRHLALRAVRDPEGKASKRLMAALRDAAGV